ncbi:MAG: hypothetical protein KH100_12975 [Dysgonomonas mossii]|uniref:hypothetical protein n=1 Tax=Dysgonomonas mossii TaxID=163665 RepID=UPI001D51A66B|nr:hypothetical protein [Dysgonomonas mossii]MBS5796741.1 hypothetical protein [Dysgonomonas mossii]MBS7112091.1 hypothetical protein [Dysgonomonas mossii]
MRLLDIKHSVNIAKEYFKFSTRNNNGIYYIHGIQSLKIAFKELIKAGIVKEENDFLEQIMHTDSDFLSSDSSVYSTRVQFLNDNNFFLTQFHSWINEYVPTEESETILNIKLPNIKSFKDLEDSSISLRKSLSQIVPEVGGELEVKQLDYGSSWIIIAVGTITAVELVLSLVKAAFVVAQKGVDLAKSLQEYKKIKMENTTLELLTKVHNEILQKEIERLAVDIDSDFFSKKDQKIKDKQPENERIGRIKNSIKNLSSFFKSGGEIYASLTAPAEIKAEIPDYKKLEPFEFAGLLNEDNQPDSKTKNQDIE